MANTYCSNCGAVIPEGSKFCETCGAPVEETAEAAQAKAAEEIMFGTAAAEAPKAEPAKQYSQPKSAPAAAPQYTAAQQAQPLNDLLYKKQYGVTSFWAFLGLIILFGLPGIGFIAALIFSFVPENKNLKNFARAWVVLKLIAFILSIALSIALVGVISAVVNDIGEIDLPNDLGDALDELIKQVEESLPASVMR